MKNPYAVRFVESLREMAEDMAQGSSARAMDILCRYLTPSEFQALAIRWEIIRRLDRGETHRSIALKLHVSTATVSRWSLEEWRWGSED